MLSVKRAENTESHIFRLLGLTVGFDATEWYDDSLALLYQGNAVCMLEGELLQAFSKHEYVKENRLID